MHRENVRLCMEDLYDADIVENLTFLGYNLNEFSRRELLAMICFMRKEIERGRPTVPEFTRR